MKTYKYVGSISSYQLCDCIDYNIELYNYENPTIPPVRVTADGDMFKYIDDLESTDDEERYLEKEFYYDSAFHLLAVVVPGSDLHPAKVVLAHRVDDRHRIIPFNEVKFYGTNKQIDERDPKSMSADEYDRLYNDVHQMNALSISRYEYPIDYWSTVRLQKEHLIKMRKRINDLEDKLSQIADIARNAE